MDDPKISDMMKMQMALWELHKDSWSPMEAQVENQPKYAADLCEEVPGEMRGFIYRAILIMYSGVPGSSSRSPVGVKPRDW